MNAKNSLRDSFEGHLVRAGFNYTRSRDDDLFTIKGDDSVQAGFLTQTPVGIKFPGNTELQVRVRSYELVIPWYGYIIQAVERLERDYSHDHGHHEFLFCKIQYGDRDLIACEKPEAYTLGIVNNFPMFVPNFSTSWNAVEVALSGRSATMIQDAHSEACLIPTEQFVKRIAHLSAKRTYEKGSKK